MIIFIMSADDVGEFHFEICKKYFPVRYEKAMRFCNENDKKLCVAAGYLIYKTVGCTEDEIEYKHNGKPYVKNCAKYFNISHSGKYAVISIAADEIGIDIEKASEKNLVCSKRVFNENEIDWVNKDVDKFSVLWTLKESVMKTLGEGLRLSAKDIDVLPFLSNKSICLNGIQLYAHTAVYDSYALSLCSVKPFETIEIVRV